MGVGGARGEEAALRAGELAAQEVQIRDFWPVSRPIPRGEPLKPF